MKKIISAIAFIVFAIVLPIHLVTDDPLDPEAQKWIEHYSTEPNLDNNAFIALIALGYDTDDSYQRATKEYLDYVERLNNTLDIYENILEYPRIVNLPTSVIDDKYCTMGEEGCFEKLETNKSEIGEDLTTSEDVLTKFLAISDYENFQPINATITEPSLEVLIKLVKLTGIQIYYQIQEGNVNRAVEMLEKLARIERFFFKVI